MNNDKYPDMGTKLKKYSMDECFDEVKKKYPNAYMEGAAGLQRSFFIRDIELNTRSESALLVGVCWSSGKFNKNFNYVWYVRVSEEPRQW